MYTEGQSKASVGRIKVDIQRNSYRIRFSYPKGTRHQFNVSKVSSEGWTTAIKAAQLINRDIDMGDFDETYARYSPSHAKQLQIAQQKKTKEYDLKELWKMYKAANKSRVAITTQNNSWEQFDRCLDSLSKRSLSLKNIELFMQELLNTYSAGTLRAVFSKCLHPSVNQAVKKKLIAENPYTEIKLPKTKRSEIECYESDEIKAIVAAFYGDTYCSNKSAYKHSYYAQMLEFLVLTGCRPEECHPLNWNDIKRRKDRVFIHFHKAYSKGVVLDHTKTRVDRLFPCNEQLIKLLNSIPKIENEHNLIFPSVKLTYVNQDNFRKRYFKPIIEGLIKDGKVHKYIKPSSLRHSFITRLIREGVDIKTVATLVGNSPQTIIDKYLASRREFDLPEF